jgi:hypothetical protein
MQVEQLGQSTLSARARTILETCYHEAGHLIACQCFKIAATPRVWIERDDDGGELLRGVVTHSPRTSAFREAQIAWAGPLAELAIASAGLDVSLAHYWLVTEPEWRMSLVQWALGDNYTLSNSDRSEISGHRQRIRAAKRALRILVVKFREVEREANRLMQEVQPMVVPQKGGL